MSSTVKLSIKAANGSVSDYRVEAGSDWTIQQLKNHLYRHYPTHPPLTSQKLIYGGRLLLDQLSLSQSVPTNTDEPIVIHLVAYERSHSSPAVSMETKEPSPKPVSRQPSLSPVQEDSTDNEQQEQLPAQDTPVTNQTTPPQTTPPWLRYRGQTNPMMMGLPPQFYMSPYGAAYANQMAMWYQAYYGRQMPAAPAEAGDADNLDLLNPGGGEDGVEVEDNVPVNAAGGAAGLGMMAGGAGAVGNRRDLVDVLYMCTMFGFLGLVAYLTGSLGRLLVFAGGIIFMLLNQSGWFAVRRRRQAAAPLEDVNPLNRPDQLPPQEQQADHQPDNQQQQDRPEPPLEQQQAERVADPPPLQQEDQQRHGILATLLVFLTSFFTSLIPHQRPEFQAN